MSTADDRADGPTPGNGEPPYRWLDEWLCEYVDGAMDPALETTFEQYVEANPELKAHIERLRKTRALLRDHSRADTSSPPPSPAPPCGPEVPPNAAESSSGDDGPLFTSGPLGVVSSVVVALLVGFFAGTTFVDAAGPSASLPPSPSVTLERDAAPTPLVPASRQVSPPSDTLPYTPDPPARYP